MRSKQKDEKIEQLQVYQLAFQELQKEMATLQESKLFQELELTKQQLEEARTSSNAQFHLKIEKLQNELENSIKEKSDLSSQCTELQAEITRLKNPKSIHNKDIQTLQAEKKTLADKVEEQAEKLNSQEKYIDELKSQIILLKSSLEPPPTQPSLPEKPTTEQSTEPGKIPAAPLNTSAPPPPMIKVAQWKGQKSDRKSVV